MLSVGVKAPEIMLPDQNGVEVTLSDFLGKKVLVYFYPKDNTPGCSKQAAAFAEQFEEFQKHGVVLIGISKDSQKSHLRFIEKYQLPFILLSDPELKAIQDYDVWQEKK